jgi:hypothetical protein
MTETGRKQSGLGWRQPSDVLDLALYSKLLKTEKINTVRRYRVIRYTTLKLKMVKKAVNEWLNWGHRDLLRLT